MQKKIFLVALDVTEDATAVMQAARTLAGQCDAQLVCMTVVQPLAGLYGSLYIMPYNTSNVSFEEEALQCAHAKLLKLAAEFGVKQSDVHTKLGNPAPEIRAAATDLKSALVIMGTHARSGFGRLLGSTANAVLHGLPCDAHLVKIRSD
jgi:universal stress protein A